MITITMLTKNNQKTLEKVLTSLKDFNEVVLVDTGSSDNTMEIASKFPNVSIYERPFTSFGKLKNEAASLAKNNWIFSLDSDEELSINLQKELLSLNLCDNTVYAFPFINFYNGKKINHSGWQKEKHVRLYNRQNTKFSEAKVHEKIITDQLTVLTLKHPIYHTSYLCIEDFLRKLQIYSSLFAEQNKDKKKSSFSKAMLHGFFSFFKSYVIKKGFLGGREGFLISFYNSQVAFYKYLKLEEINRL
ncbi:MAG TPA: glycosyltransferase family 2 protein [Chlamydiales bacterium]|nr:glycosyltransferase family 2 protein [Chlamydiales bacterium]